MHSYSNRSTLTKTGATTATTLQNVSKFKFCLIANSISYYQTDPVYAETFNLQAQVAINGQTVTSYDVPEQLTCFELLQQVNLDVGREDWTWLQIVASSMATADQNVLLNCLAAPQIAQDTESGLTLQFQSWSA